MPPGSCQAMRKLPYRRFKVYRSVRTGRLVSKKFRGKKRGEWAYISNLTRRRIPKADISKDPNVQGFREAFPGRTDKTRRRIRKTLALYREHGFNPIEKSPDLNRYFSWLKEKRPDLYRRVYRQISGKMERGEAMNVREVHEEAAGDRGDLPRRGKGAKPKKRKGAKK